MSKLGVVRTYEVPGGRKIVSIDPAVMAKAVKAAMNSRTDTTISKAKPAEKLRDNKQR